MKRQYIRVAPATPARQLGVSLIELMISLVVGLLVLGAAIGIFASNKAVYRTTENLGRLQESGQVAFELLSRDIREAGSNPCDVNLPAKSIIDFDEDDDYVPTPDGDDWFMAVDYPLYGFAANEAPAGSDYAEGTDVIQVLRNGDDVRGLTEALTGAAATAKFAPAAPQFADGDVVMICDMKALGVFRANGAGTGGAVSYGAGSLRNLCNYFPAPNSATCGGVAYDFPKFSSISSLQGVRWYVGDPDGDGILSLYREVNGAPAEEVIQGVTNLQFRYLTGAGYVSATALGVNASAWRDVRAVRMTLTLEEAQASGTGGQPLVRVVENVVALRNRVL